MKALLIPKRIKFQNMVTVGPGGVGAGYDYTDIQSAINGCARFTATADTPAVVLIYPGSYTVNFSSRSIGLDMSGPGTGNDGQNGGLDFIHLRGVTSDPSDVVITFSGIPNIAAINSRCIDAMAHTMIANVTLRCNLINGSEDATHGAGRFIHWDSGGATNYLRVRNVVFQSTTGITAISTGIRAQQVLDISQVRLEGACNISVHGTASGGNAGPAQVTYQDIDWDGTLYISSGGLVNQAGLQIDGQAVQPVHNLIARLRRISIPKAMSVSAGNYGLDILHPYDGGTGVSISSSSQASPSVVTTSAAHGLVVGDVVQIGGHNIDTMNGYWTVASTPLTTTFTATSCNNTSGANGTATGTVFKQVQIGASTIQGSTVNISSSSVASPTTFTTTGAHGFTAGSAAVAVLTATGQPSNTQTCVIDGKTYTFQTVLTDVDGNVFIGADTPTTMANLIAAINLGAGGGTAYAASTTLHATVTGSQGSSTSIVVITAKTGGTAGNSIAISETMSNASWNASTMLAGVAATIVVIAGHSDPRLNGTFQIATIPLTTTFTLTDNTGAAVAGAGDNNGAAGSGGTVLTATVIATASVHNLAVGDYVITGEHITTGNAVNGPWQVSMVPSTTTFAATGQANSGSVGGATGFVVKDLSWIYILDGTIAPNEQGVRGTRFWNHIHWPNKRFWAAKSGSAFKSGEVGVYDLTSGVESIGRTSAAGGTAWPAAISRPVGRDNVATRYPKVNTGLYANVLCTSAAVVTADTIITGTTQGQCLTDNTVTTITNPEKIVGWAITGKRSGQLGNVKVMLYRPNADRW